MGVRGMRQIRIRYQGLWPALFGHRVGDGLLKPVSWSASAGVLPGGCGFQLCLRQVVAHPGA